MHGNLAHAPAGSNRTGQDLVTDDDVILALGLALEAARSAARRLQRLGLLERGRDAGHRP